MPEETKARFEELDGRVELLTTGESTLRVAVHMQIDSSWHCTVPRVIPSSEGSAEESKRKCFSYFCSFVTFFSYF